MAPRIREPVYSPRFSKDLKRLRGSISRLDELVDAVLEVLCRDTQKGRETATTSVFGFPLMLLPNNPRAALYYSLTPTQVILNYMICENDEIGKVIM